MVIRVTVWNEFRHERMDEAVRAVYPEGIHQCIAQFLACDDVMVRTATLDEPEHGLSQQVLDDTDVLIWWGHMAHEEVGDEIVERVYQRIMQGMGLLCLHSAHASKIFSKVCGTPSGLLSWREKGEMERMFIVEPGHPVVAGLPEYFEIPHTEMYGEHFNIPQPDELLMISWFEGGEVLRSCFTLKRGKGKVMYFRPGHETFPIYYQPEVQTVIRNAVQYLCPAPNAPRITYRSNIDLPR